MKTNLQFIILILFIIIFYLLEKQNNKKIQRFTNTYPPKICWIFWFGDEMNDKRKKNLELIKKNIGLKVIFVTEKNIQQYLKWKVHPAVKYLSGIHKADYFRIYFLLHYGGAYTDIKLIDDNWSKYYKHFENPNIWVLGMPAYYDEIASPPMNDFKGGSFGPLREYHKKLIHPGFYIARKNNEYLKKVHNKQNSILQKHYKALKKYPAPDQRCCTNYSSEEVLNEPSKYPLRWAEILGEIVHKYGVVYHKHVKKSIKRISTDPDKYL